ncbi:MAG: hypothetical protein GEU96_11525 [Propionibacteriales bacterium]|nr:hypothetical protein [Propionibacteriales bacterium]
MRFVVAMLAGCLLVVGCGSPEAGSGASGDEPSADPVATKVVVTVSGGLRGVRETYTMVVDDPPTQLTAAEIDQIVDLAGGDVVRGYAGSHVERGECCDLMQYSTTITYADGDTKQIVTNDLDDSPPEYDDLVALVTRPR